MSGALIEQTTFRRILVRSVGLPLIVMTLVAFILVWQITNLLKASQWVEHTDLVITRAYETLNLLVDMEAGQRSYLVSGKPLFLEPYDRAATRFPSTLSALQRLVADNPRQNRRLNALRDTYQEWTNNARTEIALRKTGNNHLPDLDVARSIRLMDSLRGQFQIFIQAEESLRRQRSATAQLAASLTLACVLGLALGLGVVLAVSNRHRLVSLSRSYEEALHLSHDQAEELRQQADELQRQAAILQASREHLATTLRS